MKTVFRSIFHKRWKNKKDGEEGSTFQVAGGLHASYTHIQYEIEVGGGQVLDFEGAVCHDFILKEIPKLFWKHFNGNDLIQLAIVWRMGSVYLCGRGMWIRLQPGNLEALSLFHMRNYRNSGWVAEEIFKMHMITEI